MSCVTCAPETDTVVYVTCWRGDDVDLDVRFLDADDKLLDVTGWSWLGQLRDAADALAATWAVTEMDPANGYVLMSLDDSVTVGLAVGDFDWDLEGTDGEGTVKTLVVGRLRLKEDVSHE